MKSRFSSGNNPFMNLGATSELIERSWIKYKKSVTTLSTCLYFSSQLTGSSIFIGCIVYKVLSNTPLVSSNVYYTS